jgi:hypothetical protein
MSSIKLYFQTKANANVPDCIQLEEDVCKVAQEQLFSKLFLTDDEANSWLKKVKLDSEHLQSVTNRWSRMQSVPSDDTVYETFQCMCGIDRTGDGEWRSNKEPFPFVRCPAFIHLKYMQFEGLEKKLIAAYGSLPHSDRYVMNL